MRKLGLGGFKGVALLALVAGGLVSCGGTIYLRPQSADSTPGYPATVAASPLQADVDAMTALSRRPMRPPSLLDNASCPVSSSADLGAVAPNYGMGVGPAYLSGQFKWYSGGQVAILMVDARYSGPLLARGFQLSGEGLSKVTLAEWPPTLTSPSDKEKQHGVAVVPAVHTTGGGLYLEAVIPSSSWRAWFGMLSTDSPGCFGLQVDGDNFTEFIVFSVLAGILPPPS